MDDPFKDARYVGYQIYSGLKRPINWMGEVLDYCPSSESAYLTLKWFGSCFASKWPKELVLRHLTPLTEAEVVLHLLTRDAADGEACTGQI